MTYSYKFEFDITFSPQLKYRNETIYQNNTSPVYFFTPYHRLNNFVCLRSVHWITAGYSAKAGCCQTTCVHNNPACDCKTGD